MNTYSGMQDHMPHGYFALQDKTGLPLKVSKVEDNNFFAVSIDLS